MNASEKSVIKKKPPIWSVCRSILRNVWWCVTGSAPQKPQVQPGSYPPSKAAKVVRLTRELGWCVRFLFFQVVRNRKAAHRCAVFYFLKVVRCFEKLRTGAQFFIFQWCGVGQVLCTVALQLIF